MYEYDIPDMSCGHCAASVTKAIKASDPEAVADIDLSTRKAKISSSKDPQSIGAALEDAGYPATNKSA